ncbi:hypothetical 5.5 kDa protein (plasmid) [Sinorhizobium fredii NGR234]|uniref:Uncharacterized protein y4aK n=1 Tax=Sinorhizobium fredii (strain NBRC 101917 / NGR234) TaxID=394 RepID=Y4AK_SINFN|nr:RecName: Full=Uncharacterized protein y4aK [Sinorhizobium fredii NGR234]AAB91608.1 hypothetical 5.5 kDa protein [Sinorhizobium fredii NGR234]
MLVARLLRWALTVSLRLDPYGRKDEMAGAVGRFATKPVLQEAHARGRATA